jgi:hypothetical protein
MARLCQYRLSIGLSALFRALNRNGGIASPIIRTSTFLRYGRSEGDFGYSWSPGAIGCPWLRWTCLTR